MTNRETTDARPVFRVPVRPTEVPTELLALADDSEVCYVNEPMAGLSGGEAGRASALVAGLRQTIDRQRAGRFWLVEAAQILADAHSLNASRLRGRMEEAFRLGALHLRDPDTGTRLSPGEVQLTFHNAYVTPADVDAWLDSDGADYRFPTVAGTASSTPPTPVSEAVVPAPAGASGAIEEPHQRQDRRLDAVRAAGGDHNGTKMTGRRGVLAELARSEKAAGRPMSDEKNIREDLKAAGRRESVALRDGTKGCSIFTP